MNAEQLQITLRSSQYAEHVLELHRTFLEQDFQLDRFTAHLPVTIFFKQLNKHSRVLKTKPHG